MNDDVISEEILGLVHDEHYEPKKRQTFTPMTVRAERKEYVDRTFYTLMIQPDNSADLNREGWKQLRDLCDAVLNRMEQDT